MRVVNAIRSNLQDDLGHLFWAVAKVVNRDDIVDSMQDLRRAYDKIHKKLCGVCRGKETYSGCYLCRGELDPDGVMMKLQTDLRNLLEATDEALIACDRPLLNLDLSDVLCDLDYAHMRVHEKLCEQCRGVGNRRKGCHMCRG